MRDWLKRDQLVDALPALLGGEVLSIISGTGWPAEARVVLGAEVYPARLYIANVIAGGGGRSADECRIYPPGKVGIEFQPGVLTLVIGVSFARRDGTPRESPVVVAWDLEGNPGEGKRNSRYASWAQLNTAEHLGWQEERNAIGERVVAMMPDAFVAYVVDMLQRSGGPAPAPPQLSNRALVRERKAVLVNPRYWRFRQAVIPAYGARCGVCSIALEEVLEAAHVYPVEAGDAEDDVTNGLSLCRNHHALFDRHALYIDPASWRVVVHPRVLNPKAGCMSLLGSTTPILGLPHDPRCWPSRESFDRRYDFYAGEYGWVTAA